MNDLGIEKVYFVFYSVVVYDPDDRIVENHTFDNLMSVNNQFKFLKKKYSKFYKIDVYRHENTLLYDSEGRN